MAVTSPEDAINQALRQIGYPKAIGSIYEGSPGARAGLEIYSQTRDELQRAFDWPFTSSGGAPFALPLLKGPPPPGGYTPANPWTSAFPAPGWLYEYLYPADCLELRAIIPPPAAMFVLDPKPATWRIVVDEALNPNQKVILSNVKGAMAVYCRRIADPTLWEPGFTQALIAALAKQLATSPLLTASPDFVKMMPQELATAIAADRKLG